MIIYAGRNIIGALSLPGPGQHARENKFPVAIGPAYFNFHGRSIFKNDQRRCPLAAAAAAAASSSSLSATTRT